MALSLTPMREFKLPSAAAHKITVTNTATSIKDLIETAASAALSAMPAINIIEISPEDYSIRFLADGLTPTAANGILVRVGDTRVINASLSDLKLIRAEGTNAVCSVRLGWSDGIAESSTAASIFNSDVEIGAVELKDGSTDVRAKVKAASTSPASSDVVLGVQQVRVDGSVDPTMTRVSVTLTRPNDTTAYAAGDAVTDSTSAPTVLTFSSAARAAGKTGDIVRALMVDSANVATKGSFELWLFNASVTPDNDNAVFTPTDAELATCIGVIPFTLSYIGDATSGAGGNAIYIGTLSEPIKFTSASGNLFGLVVVRNAYTPVAQEAFTFMLDIDQR